MKRYFYFLIVFLIFNMCCHASFLKSKEWQSAVQTPEDQSRLAFFQSLYEKEGGRSVEDIPKVFHVIWLGPQPFPSESISHLRSWMDRHAGWQMKWWSDHDHPAPLSCMQQYAFENFPLGDLIDLYYSAQSFEERSVILRYAILLSEGGIYIDPDAECLTSIEPLRAGNDFFCGLEIPGPTVLSSSINPSSHLIASTKGHPILRLATEWLVAHWQEYEWLFPGTDSLSISNRMVHRAANSLSLAIEKGADKEGRTDRVFPPHFFHATKKDGDGYATLSPKTLFGSRRAQAQNKEKVEEAFTSIRTELRICLILIFALAALNIVLGAVIFHLFRKEKKK